MNFGDVDRSLDGPGTVDRFMLSSCDLHLDLYHRYTSWRADTPSWMGTNLWDFAIEWVRA